jgi:hypothetical protein
VMGCAECHLGPDSSCLFLAGFIPRSHFHLPFYLLPFTSLDDLGDHSHTGMCVWGQMYYFLFFHFFSYLPKSGLGDYHNWIHHMRQIHMIL